MVGRARFVASSDLMENDAETMCSTWTGLKRRRTCDCHCHLVREFFVLILLASRTLPPHLDPGPGPLQRKASNIMANPSTQAPDNAITTDLFFARDFVQSSYTLLELPKSLEEYINNNSDNDQLR